MNHSESFIALRGVMKRASDMVLDAPPHRIDLKGHQDFVTDVDFRLDAFLQTALKGIVPGALVMSEERETIQDTSPSHWWIVDPLDGTGNLVAGLEFVGICAALVDENGPKLSAVAAPFQKKLWMAERGRGAWMNDKALSIPVQAPDLVVASTGVLDSLHTRRGNRTEDQQDSAWEKLRTHGKLRNLGAQSLHLCGVAQGWFAAALSREARIWDEAAAGLILREAGGIWKSAADKANWLKIREVMQIPAQNSVACHPDLEGSLENFEVVNVK